MIKRVARRREKENQQENVNPQDEGVKGKYFLIVEAANTSPSSKRSQFWLISSKDLVDVPVINGDTVYTGKKLKFRSGESKITSGTCVVFSPDFHFVQTQFQSLTMDSGKEKPSAPLILNNSTKGNILNISANGGGGGALKPRNNVVKLPAGFTIKTLTSNGLQTQDTENIPPKSSSNVILGCGQPARVLTYDQQSQTDTKMFDPVLPATASQMHQHASQMAQLIRANNGLVTEVNRLKESNSEMKSMIAELDKKLFHCIDLLESNKGTALTKIDKVEEYEVIQYDDSTSCMDAFTAASTVANGSIVASSREQSVARSTKSEHTPPLKKNKEKLDNSMRESKQSLYGSQDPISNGNSEEDVVLGVNGTTVPMGVVSDLNIKNFSAVTRKILAVCFDRETLATHSLTGKPSPAFLDRGAKLQLDPKIIEDIVRFVTNATGASDTQIRAVITSKCADENKMRKVELKRLSASSSLDSSKSNPAKRRFTSNE